MGFTFNGHHPVLIKLHASGIVFEGGNNQGMVDSRCRFTQPLQESKTFPGSVIAMITPRLRQDLDLGIGVRPALGLLVRLNGLHLGKWRVPGTGLGERNQFRIRQIQERNRRHRIGIPGGTKRGQDFVRLADALDNMVVEKTRGNSPRLGFIQAPELVAPAESCEFQACFTQCSRPCQNGGRFRVGHGGPISDFNNRPESRLELGALSSHLVKRIHQKRHEAFEVHRSLEPKDALDH